MLRVAIDFDDTIVENAYPKIGKPKLFAFETLIALQKKGFRLILWTVRTGKELDEAVEFCKQHGIVFYAVNSNYPEETFDPTVARKIEADIFIDDRNIGGFPGWGEVWQMMFPQETDPNAERERLEKFRRPSLLKRIFIKRK